MAHLWAWIDYARDHPLVAAGAAVGFAVLCWLLNRKSALSRSADARLGELRKNRADYYNQQRPTR